MVEETMHVSKLAPPKSGKPMADRNALLAMLNKSEADLGSEDFDDIYDDLLDADTEEEDFELGVDTPSSMTSIKKEVCKSLAEPHLKNESTASPDFLPETLDENKAPTEDKALETVDKIKAMPVKTKIIAGVIVVAVIALVIVVGIINNNNSSQPAETTQPQAAVTVQKYANPSLAVTDAQTYVDTVYLIDKYFYFEKDTCVFVFNSYAQRARANLQIFVSIDEYNAHQPGEYVEALYERVTINDTDYYMKGRFK